jgi:hypothetical protein
MSCTKQRDKGVATEAAEDDDDCPRRDCGEVKGLDSSGIRAVLFVLVQPQLVPATLKRLLAPSARDDDAGGDVAASNMPVLISSQPVVNMPWQLELSDLPQAAPSFPLFSATTIDTSFQNFFQCLSKREVWKRFYIIFVVWIHFSLSSSNNSSLVVLKHDNGSSTTLLLTQASVSGSVHQCCRHSPLPTPTPTLQSPRLDQHAVGTVAVEVQVVLCRYRTVLRRRNQRHLDLHHR